MTFETVHNTNLSYYLIAFDDKGQERTDDPDGLMSQVIVDVLKKDPITDVFIFSHGWLGDIPAARRQYTNWVTAMGSCTADIQRIVGTQADFRPLLIGIHWPSLPWGDENFLDATTSSSFDVNSAGSATTSASSVDDLTEQYVQRLVDTPRARAALNTILSAAQSDPLALTMPEEVRNAYVQLDQEVGLKDAGLGAAPGEDREGFEPEEIFEASQMESFDAGGFSLGGLLAPLRLLSFWKMKDRARQIGETAGFHLLNQLQQAVGERQVRFHLMGHSFGCIVVSSTLAGPGGHGTLTRPVDSVTLVQGALSLWSYSTEIPPAPGQAGYFNKVLIDKKVAGPILTTQSEFDYAVGRSYPLAAGVMQQVSFAPGELPRYGGVGAFGIRGPHLDLVDLKMLPLGETYHFEPGKIYNIDSSQFISKLSGPSGAHSDIAHPEVAHAVWSAVRV